MAIVVNPYPAGTMGPVSFGAPKVCTCTTCDGSPVPLSRSYLCYCGALASLPAPKQTKKVP